jgi:hypothetical protein
MLAGVLAEAQPRLATTDASATGVIYRFDE